MSIRQEAQQELSNLDLDEEVVQLALAALAGEDEIERVLSGGEADVPEEPTDAKAQIPKIFLQNITVAGFRGIGPEATLEIPPGPGLTVVVGRNGSGKSSFSEALEVLLTGDSYRWKEKSKSWERGWKNLHHGDNPKITAHFHVEEMSKPTIVERTWNEGSGIADSEYFAQHHGQPRSDLDGIGWEEPLNLYRPILSYNELSMVESRPTDLHDILAKVLSIGDLSVVAKNLAQVRLKRERYKNEVDNDLKDNILPALDGSDDERAINVKEALTKRPWDLKVITDLGLEPDADYKVLQDIMNLAVPAEGQVTRIAEEIDLAYTSLSNRSNKDIESAERVKRLLETALKHYELHHKNQPCPVCGVGLLDECWHTSALEQVDQLKYMTRDYRKANEDLDRALEKAQKLVTVPDIPVSDAVDTEELSVAWNQWSLLPGNRDKVSKHLLSQYSLVRDKLSKVFEQASQRFSEREEKWRTILTKLLEWVSRAQKVVKEEPEIAKIRKAEEAAKTVTDNIRTKRWAPIELKALELWNDNLKLGSNIDLRSVGLDGARNMRRVNLQVDVDGIKTEAPSVVSQGELNCLALSLFFPRAMLPASPFRFLMIDDPIQTMDQARVEGLAKVFTKIAKEYQLIVFTHDNRLPKFLRLRNQKHYYLEVTRRRKDNRQRDWVVKVKKKSDPVVQCFRDARSIVEDKKFPSEMKKKVIPGLCRSGLEAACWEAVWARGLKKEDCHERIEKRLLDAITLSRKVSLLFDKQHQPVVNTISDKWGKKLAESFSIADDGTHNKPIGDLNLYEFIDNCESLAKKLRHYKV